MHTVLRKFGSNVGKPGLTTFEGLLISICIVLPALSSLIYPTYVHYVQPAWFEWTRLQELPFVVFEVLVWLLARATGFDPKMQIMNLPKDIKIALIFVFVGLLVGSVFISRQPLNSVFMSLVTCLHFGFLLAVSHLVRGLPVQKTKLVMQMLALSVVMLALCTAVRFSFPPPLDTVPNRSIQWTSAIPGFINVRHFGSWTGAIAAGFAIAILYGPKNRDRNLCYIGYVLCSAVTIWTGTRAALLAMMFVAGLTAIQRRQIPSVQAIGRAIVLTLVAFALALPLLPAEADFHLYVPGDLASAQSFSANRSSLWSLTFWRWLDSPFFGWGSGSTFWEVYAGWMHTQPHNAVLQFLISWGVVGTAGILYLLGRAIHNVHAKGMNDESLRPLLMILYAFLFQSLFEGMLHYPRFIEIIILLFVVIYNADNKQKLV